MESKPIDDSGKPIDGSRKPNDDAGKLNAGSDINQQIRDKLEEEKQDDIREKEMDKKFSIPPAMFRQACDEVA